jgi:3-hydroxymyristoyl/3-hydroxydecanoyl-(acyl carrier protein) dehydratase
MECLFQLGNWLIVLSSDFTQMGLLVRVEEILFHEPLRPGQRLRMDIEVSSYRKDGIVFNGTATAAGRQIAFGRGCLATPVDLAGFHDPADLKVLFSEIHRPLTEGLA